MGRSENELVQNDNRKSGYFPMVFEYDWNMVQATGEPNFIPG